MMLEHVLLLAVAVAAPAAAATAALAARSSSAASPPSSCGGGCVETVFTVNDGDDGRVVHERAYGAANVASGAMMAADTNVRVASVTKQLTATVAAMLAEKQRLEIDAKLHKYVPELPDYAKEIRVRHLVHHMSGLPDYTTVLCAQQRRNVTNSDVLAWLLTQTALDFAPGSRFEYSNTGYIMLALVVTRAAAVPTAAAAAADDDGVPSFPVLVDAMVLREYVGGGTVVANTTNFGDIAHRAVGYDADGTLMDTSTCAFMAGDGGWFVSAAGARRYVRALLAGLLVANTTTLFAPAYTTGGERIDYGYGWMLTNVSVDNAPLMWHNGGFLGFRSAVLMVPSRNVAVVVECNCADGGALDRAAALLKQYYECCQT